MNVKQLLRCGDGSYTPSPVTAIERIEVEPENNIVEPDLKDDEVDYILERLMYFRDNVFKDIAMTDTIKKDMMYNLPEGLVQASKSASAKGLDFMDPVMTLYPVFADGDLQSVYAKYLKQLQVILNSQSSLLDFFGAPSFAPTVQDPTIEDGTDYEPDGEPDDEDVIDEDDIEQ